MIIPTIIHREDGGCRDFRFMSYAALHCVGVLPVRALKKRTKCCGYSKPRRWLIWVIERPSRSPLKGDELSNSLALARMRSLIKSFAVRPVSVFTNVPKYPVERQHLSAKYATVGNPSRSAFSEMYSSRRERNFFTTLWFISSRVMNWRS